MAFLWTYVIGLVLTLLPRRWRLVLGSGEVCWERAGVLSGLLEGGCGIAALGYWWMYGIHKLIGAGIDTAINGNAPPGVTDQDIGGVSYVVMMTHPVTWVLVFFIVEGAVRLCAAAFTETVPGTVPLAVLDWTIGMFQTKEERPRESLRRNTGSFVGAMKEKMMEARAKDVEDELSYRKSGQEEILEIRASRKKQEWVTPKVVRVDDVYYRLEESGTAAGTRPFWYRLRRLPVGVPGRNVIFYTSPTRR